MSISVLMSVYRSEKAEYLDRAITSVWDDQTLKPDEIVLVEDGPLGPDLQDIIKKWRTRLGDKLVIIVNEVNLGLTKSLNKGLMAASCDLIARMDSDDISMPERFRIQSEYMNLNPAVDVLGAGIQEIDENNIYGALRTYPRTAEMMKRYIYKASPIAHPTVMMRRRLFTEYGIEYDEQYIKSQDLNLWFSLLSKGFVLENIVEPLLFFRRTSDTYSKRSSKASLNCELKIYFSGIRKLYGPVSWRYIYPLLRYGIKLMPPRINALIYRYLFKKKN